MRSVRQRRIEAGVDRLRRYDEDRVDFADEHGLSFKQARWFKGCLVVRFPIHRRRGTSRRRLVEYGELARLVSSELELHEDEFPLLSLEERALKAGIYVLTEGCNPVWAIPNEFERTIAVVRAALPGWAKVRT